MKVVFKISLVLTFFSYSLFTQAQQDLTLYELRSVPQASQLNASRTPLSKGYVLLPALSGFYATLYNEGFNYSDMVTDDGDSLRVDMAKGISRMKKLNDLGTDIRTVLLGFGFRTGATYITFNVEQKISARFTYPKTLFEFAWYGNADPRFLDERVSMDGLGFDYMQYTEASLGWAKDIDEKLSLGVRAKYLNGTANLKTTDSQLGFTTKSDAYEISVDGSFSYKSAGLAGYILDDSTPEGEKDAVSAATGNHGAALDVGFTYRIDNRLSVSGAINDVGLINWSSGVKNGVADTVNFTYEGESVKNWSQTSINGKGIIDALDTLFKGIEFQENSESYSTWLPTKIYIGANYRVLQKTDLSILSYNEFYNNRFKSSIRAALTHRIRNWLMATVNYSFYGRSASNVGVGFSINGGPVQLYAVTDNVVSYLLPTKNKNFHLRFGINLTFANNFSQN
ncbi:MAG: hypothetical protein CL840_09985 [Crocinitomicaceae bacterium]|nr:hypothetical protein [Crocinitomicaceae bacterium]|tara:strand:- start:25027 stop:26385 length:1359 start_codon:yes stop_codon:yes gene_type:complete